MRIYVKFDGIDEALAALNPKEYKKALSKTVRRMGQRFRTTATKEVRKTYNIKSAAVKRRISTSTVRKGGKTTWRLDVRGTTVGVINFGARQKRRGVSVLIKRNSGRELIRGAFIARGKNNNMHVFVRISKERMDLESKKTLSVPQMFSEEILGKAQKEVEVSYEKEFRHNLDFYLGRLK